MILELNQVASHCEKIRNQNTRIVFTNGCFDILHLGHVTYLKQARELGDFLFVGLNSDASVKKLKGEGRPVQNQKDRAEILSALRFVDAVCIFNEETPLNLIKLVKPLILVKGGDWELSKIVGRDFVESSGGVCKTLPFVSGHSTTTILEKIKTL
ncbi:MAG: D-glycero-beta-D-manno-heptose 1-phosphate adenylyltransferase [Oligoflexia bacterium]|nr:D-glycero-beta-D-manno-heptose 1-phosphate adenylyltransferase [Oligoflexia bacterium]